MTHLRRETIGRNALLKVSRVDTENGEIHAWLFVPRWRFVPIGGSICVNHFVLGEGVATRSKVLGIEVERADEEIFNWHMQGEELERNAKWAERGMWARYRSEFIRTHFSLQRAPSHIYQTLIAALKQKKHGH